jgi:hypothetical protein
LTLGQTFGHALVVAGAAASLGCASLGCASIPPPRTTLDEAPPRLVSAFFGLDHAMPASSRGLCWKAPGQDGMPVTFTRRVVGAFEPSAFTVRTRSGALRHPECATTAPADARAKNHTVLLIGDLGGEPDDPPVSVEVTGRLPLEGGVDGNGLAGPVIPLAAGPTLVLALGLRAGAIASDCPARTRQIVVAIWAGGVKPSSVASQAAHLGGYRVTTRDGVVAPFALGDLGDRDNYVHLCLDTEAPAERVSFPAGLLVDPRGDRNPDTTVEISRQR